MKWRRRVDSGFTLLELLVAIAMMSIVVLGVMATFQSMLSVYSKVRDGRESAMQVRMFIGLFGDDLRTASNLFAFNAYRSSGIVENSRILDFTSGISVYQKDAEPKLGSVLVSYSIRRGEEGKGWILQRGERPYPNLVGGWQEVAVPVLENIESFNLYYEDAYGAEQEFFSMPANGKLPATVRLSMTLRNYEEGTISYNIRFPVGQSIF